MSILELKNICYTYGVGTPFEKKAVNDVSFSVNKGELIGIIGHTGSGKSTLVQMLNGLMKPTSGQVLLDGVDIWDKPKEIRKIRFKVGMVFSIPNISFLRKPFIRISLSAQPIKDFRQKKLIRKYEERRDLQD